MVHKPATKELTEAHEERDVLVAATPLTFDEFTNFFDEDDEVELIDGVVVKQMAARDPHENVFGWLYFLLRGYVTANELGVVRGSRTPVRISEHRARLPDLVFVRRDRADIVREKGIYGAPDLVVEVVSPGDTLAHLVALEADYRSIGVRELWFIDQEREGVRVVRARRHREDEGDAGYTEQVFTEGRLHAGVVAGFWLDVAWLFAEPLPVEVEILQELLGEDA